MLLFKGLTWATVFPLFQAPDEQAHFSYVQYWVENKELPQNVSSKESGVSKQLDSTLDLLAFEDQKFNPFFQQTFNDGGLIGPGENQILQSNRSTRPNQNYNAYSYPPLYYATLWPAYLVFEGDILSQAMAMRWTSVVISLLTVFFIYKAAKEYFEDEFWALSVATLVAFQPMFSYLSSVINNDVTMNLAYAGFFYYALKFLKSRGNLTWKQTAILSIWILIGVLSKTQGYGLIGLFLLVWALKLNWKKLNKKTIITGIGLLTLVFIATKQLFIHDFKSQGAAVFNFFKVNSMGDFILYLSDFSRMVFDSFWGRFGWLDTSLWPPLLTIFKIFTLVTLIGFGKYLWGNWRNLKKDFWFLVLSTLILLGSYLYYFSNILFIIHSFPFGYADQGRFYFIMIVPFTLLGLKGLMEWVPKKYQNAILFGLTFLMILFNFTVLFNLIIPRYYV